MGRILAFVYGAVCYLIFFVTFLYSIGFVGNLVVPKSIDSGATGSIGRALLVNGLFIAGTVVAIDQENYATAAVVGGIGLPFYLGNIYGAANAANKWNLSLHRDLRDRLAVTLDYCY